MKCNRFLYVDFVSFKFTVFTILMSTAFYGVFRVFISSVNSNSITSLLTWMPFNICSYLIALPESSIITLNKSANFPQFVLIHTVNLEKDMVTHSSVLAWRIPWTEEPGRLQSTESQRVRHDWRDLAHSTLSFCIRMKVKGGKSVFLLVSYFKWDLKKYSLNNDKTKIQRLVP